MKTTKTLALTLIVGFVSSLSAQGFLGESWVEGSLGYVKLKESGFRPDGYTLGAAVNFPSLSPETGVGLDFKVEAGFTRVSQGGNSARVVGAGITAPFFVETGPGIKPYLAPNAGITRASGGGSSDTSGFIGLSFGVELEAAPELHVTPMIDYSYDLDDSIKTWTYGVEAAHSFSPQYALLLGYSYSDVRRAGSGYAIYGGVRMRF